MSSEKTTAIVLRVIDFSETSCVVTMLTREFGKITAMAKGARRPKSPFEAAIDILAIIRIVFLHKSLDVMDLLTEAKLERRFRNRSGDLKWLYAAYYVVELLRTMTEDDDPHPELFDLAVTTIEFIDHETKLPVESNNNELILCLLRFEVGLLKVLGHLPLLTRCVECGRERTTQNRVSFGLQAGGVLCRKCRAGQPQVVNVNPDALELLGQLSDSVPTGETEAKPSADTVFENRASYTTTPLAEHLNKKNVAMEVRNLMNHYISHLLGFEPRLHKFLK